MEIGKLQDFTIDQFAGSLALVLGSVGGLLMIIWKSRCACRINCCYLFRCERLPPPTGAPEGESDGEESIKPTQDSQAGPQLVPDNRLEVSEDQQTNP